MEADCADLSGLFSGEICLPRDYVSNLANVCAQFQTKGFSRPSAEGKLFFYTHLKTQFKVGWNIHPLFFSAYPTVYKVAGGWLAGAGVGAYLNI